MTTKRIRVLIGSPVRQQPEILKFFLDSLLRLDRERLEISYYFIDDNTDRDSSLKLSEFILQSPRVIIQAAHRRDEYLRNETTHYWNDSLIWKVADYKNKIIQYALDLRFDYLFLLDSDLLLHPASLQHLIASDKDILSEIFWTRWQPEARPQPQVWLKDEYTQWVQHRGEVLNEAQKEERYQAFIQQLTEPGIYEVGGLGACTLISRKALLCGVHYDPIYNLSFWGEDRHFSIRAAALGFTLYVDTHYPAFHVYRDSDLPDAAAYMQHTGADPDLNKEVPPQPPQSDPSLPGSRLFSPVLVSRGRDQPSLTLTMVLKNEGERYLRQALMRHREYIHQAVIIDDGSTDITVEVCLEVLKGIPLRLIVNEHSMFHNEIELRKRQWQALTEVQPEWILNLDADEWFEPCFAKELPKMLRQSVYDVFCFRLYDMWSNSHYREDECWRSHHYYRPFLVRYRPDFHYEWKETAQHCGRYPANILDLPHQLSSVRLQHYGWAKPEDRLNKLRRYQSLDPEARYGWRAQYESILDEAPRLIEWSES